jgi:DNA-binding response OmpR family regulator
MLLRKIIIQDRNLGNANTLRLMLTHAGYSVITIKTQRALNSLIEKFKPDLLIIESNVNDKDAKRILSDIKRNLNIKVIATDCNSDKAKLLKEIGFDDCLTKPFKADEIQKVVKKQLAA